MQHAGGIYLDPLATYASRITDGCAWCLLVIAPDIAVQRGLAVGLRGWQKEKRLMQLRTKFCLRIRPQTPEALEAQEAQVQRV